MARRNRNRGRVTPANANQRLPLDMSPLHPFDAERQLDFFRDLLPVEDRRTWHPEGEFRPARSFHQSRHRLTLVDQPRPKRTPLNPDRFAYLRSFNSQTKARIAFSAPTEVLVCVRRRRRREVLHAFRKTGKRGQRRPRRGWYSKISCRR